MNPAPEALEQAFLDDIVAHPDDPSLWLILSDWLDERNDSRAELVRLTWQLQYEPDHADFASRQTRLQALLAGGMVPVRPRRTVADIEFAWIPPGTFLMGSAAEEPGHQNDETQHRVTLTRGFLLGVTPVTQAQWQFARGDNPSSFKGTTRPVEQVSWDDCQDFCAKLGAKTGQRFRLPTEAEWEYACRAGTTSLFHFGSIISTDLANYDGDRVFAGSRKGAKRGVTTTLVRTFPANAWGLYDMHGNVLEWCADWYGKYRLREKRDPAGAKTGEQRVLRGGSWVSDPCFCRAADRFKFPPDTGQNNVLGCRVVLCLD
jgi:uncharacterized protein (TIGR02996 family)